MSGRRPGVVESLISWAAWAMTGLIAVLLAFATIFPVGFSGAYPEQADDAATLAGWAVLTLALVVLAPIGMAIGHWRHWHIWYWPVLCSAAAVTTLVLLQAL
ncbi:hypothetical protein BA059_01430 [Mycolicibacterium sp. (ex Dasyatis americana)]|uniref:hypothetical protein n=1 Tax=Mycobacterium sp. DBP42 TaxID=2545267 RepID=UPI000871DFC4|nr:hypothetical protein [Mycobacterium sp. DBP42]OFB45681.1 hypothetical protein BA059_01430 [Mycolicibacterium sp. (ex Dasyatis americana)]TMS50545.1 hypothetical protein E0T84_23480 [Mycobacterium sp. DBP42]